MDINYTNEEPWKLYRQFGHCIGDVQAWYWNYFQEYTPPPDFRVFHVIGEFKTMFGEVYYGQVQSVYGFQYDYSIKPGTGHWDGNWLYYANFENWDFYDVLNTDWVLRDITGLERERKKVRDLTRMFQGADLTVYAKDYARDLL